VTASDEPANQPADGPADDVMVAVEQESEAEVKDAERAVFFSDAVVAIAITLLALDLPLPMSKDGLTNSQLLHQLWTDDSGAYISCLISFFVIGNHWMVHRATFRYVRRVNHAVNLLNLVWLLTMVLTPFAARLLSGHGAFGVRFGFYALVQAIAVASLLQIRRLLSRQHLLAGNAPAAARNADNLSGYVILGLFLVSIPIGFVTQWAYACWAAAPVVTPWVRRLFPSATKRAG
jgi:uncharacterized membrane protein